VLRLRYGFTLVEAGAALERTATQVERLENGRTTLDHSAEEIIQIFEEFSKSDYVSHSRLFLRFPLRIARYILGLSVEEIARKYRTSPSQWRKLECEARDLTPSLRSRIEKDIQVVLRDILA
jgi:transcriptional regulator with XRE-family HTH domain